MSNPSDSPSQLLGAAALGRRVTVRLLAGGVGPSGGPAMRDVVGTLESLAAGGAPDAANQWQVRRKDGSVVRIDVDQVVLAKVIAEPGVRGGRGARAVSVADLELIAAAGWRPLVRHQLGGWTLRTSGGFTGRANSVLPLGDPELDIDSALDYVARWYQARRMSPLFQLPLPLTSALDAALERRGWTASAPTSVMVADLAEVLLAGTPIADGPPVQFAAAPSSAWLDIYSYREQPLPKSARAVMVNAAHPVFASIASPGTPKAPLLAVGRGAVHHHWLGVTALDVVEDARRRGLASHLMHALFEHAKRFGIRHVYLQVAEDNEAAIALYAKLGFSPHHRYHYRRRDSN
ncbi:MAG: GNAT family N-acetyltransferase [Candidatus Nanopelagicales bacterium]